MRTSGKQVLCPIVVGRADELALIDDVLEHARGSAGGLLLIGGEAGIGKTRLAREADSRARQTGMVSLRGRAVQTAVPIPFRPIAEAIQSALRASATPEAPGLEPYRSALATFVPEYGSSSGAREVSPFLLLEGIVRLLRALAGETGMLLVLEDLHWADADSLAVVEYLSDNLASEPILCVGTIRSDESSPALALAEALAARRAASLVSLSRLAPDEVEEMTRASLGEQAPSAVLRAVKERADGVPFVIEEMLGAYVAAGGPTKAGEQGWGASHRAAVTLPSSYRELVRDRLAALDQRARAVVTAAALFGPVFDWSLLPGITELSEERVLAGLRAAAEIQLISTSFETGFRFRHALIPETIVAELLPPERAALSRRTAEVIEHALPGLPGDWCERAADLREDGGDVAMAATHLMEAGRRALKRAALGTAEELLERARALIEGDIWHRFGVDRLLIETLAQSGKHDRIEEIAGSLVGWYDEKASLMEAMAISSMYVPAARAMAVAGNLARARDFIASGRAAAERAGAEENLLRMRALEAEIDLAEHALDRAREAATEVLFRSELLDLTDLVIGSLITLGLVSARAGDIDAATASLERARATAVTSGHVTLQIAAMLELGSIELWHGSSKQLEAARELAVRSGAVSSVARAELLIAWSHVLRLELEPARDALDRCVDSCVRYRLPLLSDAHFAKAAFHAFQADRAEMNRAIDAANEAGKDLADPSPGAHAARGTLALIEEDRATAIGALDRAIDAITPTRLLTFTPGLWALLCAIDGADDELARERARSLWSARLPDDAAALRQADAVALGRIGEHEQAAAAFAEADASIAALPWNRHIARRLVAEAAIRDGWGEPAAWLSESVAFFESAGLDRIASACKALMRKVGARVPRKGRGDSDVPAALRARGLTSREMDVLILLGGGLSNKAIAERLFLSPRTVETHVGSLTRKLQVGARADLVAFAAGITTDG